jgi:hypothetical protein
MKRRRHHEVVDIKEWIGLFPIQKYEKRDGPRVQPKFPVGPSRKPRCVSTRRPVNGVGRIGG